MQHIFIETFEATSIYKEMEPFKLTKVLFNQTDKLKVRAEKGENNL
jgi:hypothetical protein